MKNDPRAIALSILNELDATKETLDRVSEKYSDITDSWDRRDRALFNMLLFGVLRWRGRIDWLIGTFSNIPFRKIDSPVLNILRIGTYQIVYLERIPDSAAVNTAVNMAKETAPPWVVRFVNGVLRSIARKHHTATLPHKDRDLVPAISIDKSFPQRLIKRWLARYGEKETEHFCDACNKVPPITVRTNTMKTKRGLLLDELQPLAETVETTSVSPDGISMRRLKKPIPEMTPFREGLFQIQDEAAQIISILLDPQPGESILDACAGLGGKTGHIAQLMENRGSLLAIDKRPEKLKLLALEMDRLCVSIAETCRHELTRPIASTVQRSFNRILLDAPCSGLGVLRRNPDAKWSVTEKSIQQHSKNQAVFLDQVANSVITGGILVYAVCTLEPEETEDVIKEFLKQRPEFAIDSDMDGLPDPMRALMVRPGVLRTLPHRHDMDGFYAVRLKRLT